MNAMPVPISKGKEPNRCLSCGTTENIGRRRYCSIDCRQKLRQRLDMRSGLLQALSPHFAADLVDGILGAERAEEALAPFVFIVGTTVRTGSARGHVPTPRVMVEQIVEISQKNEVALLFGPKDTGLSNEEIRFSQMLVMITSSPRYRSLTSLTPL